MKDLEDIENLEDIEGVVDLTEIESEDSGTSGMSDHNIDASIDIPSDVMDSENIPSNELAEELKIEEDLIFDDSSDLDIAIGARYRVIQ